MKVIKEPSDHPRLPAGWWIGQRQTCSGSGGCGAIVELDVSDNPRIAVFPDSEGAFFPCSCGANLAVFQSRVVPVRSKIIDIKTVQEVEAPPAKTPFYRRLIGGGS